MSTEVGVNIEVPFVMPEPDTTVRTTRKAATCNRSPRRGGLPTEAPDHSIVRCVGSSEGQPIMEVGNGNRWDSIVGAYYHESGILVMVSQAYGYHHVCDVVVPQESRLYFGGFMRPNPERRFSNCPIGRNWHYHRSPMRRISMRDLAEVIVNHCPGGLPMLVHEYLSTDLPEAVR